MKKKLSATIEEDAYELLTRAAASERLNVSEMLERSVRYACSEYLPHAIDATLLENGGCSVVISMRGESFYARRAARRHAAEGVRASLRVEPPARIHIDRVTGALLQWQEPASRAARSGHTLRATIAGISLQLADLPLRAESDPAFVRGILREAAEAIAASEVTSFGQIARRRCPSCGYFLAKLSIWSDPRDPRDREEREWTCGLGHETTIGYGAAPEPSAIGRVAPRDAAEALADIGTWQGESSAELTESLGAARRRGGTRRVPGL